MLEIELTKLASRGLPNTLGASQATSVRGDKTCACQCERVCSVADSRMYWRNGTHCTDVTSRPATAMAPQRSSWLLTYRTRPSGTRAGRRAWCQRAASANVAAKKTVWKIVA